MPVYRWLWWKKYLTITQMLQFFFAMVMTINAIRIGCDFPMWMQYTLVAYMVSFLFLFSKYFYHEYSNHKAVALHLQRKKMNNAVGNGVATRVGDMNGCTTPAGGCIGVSSNNKKKLAVVPSVGASNTRSMRGRRRVNYKKI